MSGGSDRRERSPAPRQYLAADEVLDTMGERGARRIRELSALRVLVLAVAAGGFITMGALFSVLLAAAVEAEGAARLLEGIGFSAGFFFVILADAVLFTEANVVLPATLIDRDVRAPVLRVARFWALAFAGNLIGAFLAGWAVEIAQSYPPETTSLLSELVDRKMQYRQAGGAGSWFEAMLSGVLANWLVGMAAFFAVMGRTIFGMYVPVALAVTLFVAANFQHSPANMGYFGLIMPGEGGPGWGPALWWNLIPAGLGNVIGGTFLVVLPFWFALHPHERKAVARPDGREQA